tara:strand:- start:18841 stop:19275 length:435 start_codon:yes stop_codon:yes gene_type:complete
MNILILHGPNMNLIGVHSAAAGEQITLDKINHALQRKAREMDATLKILQTHDRAKAITFLQRNRNWAEGCLIAPGAWARSAYDLRDTLQLCKIRTVEIHFDTPYDPSKHGAASILSETCLSTETASPVDAYLNGLKLLTTATGE